MLTVREEIRRDRYVVGGPHETGLMVPVLPTAWYESPGCTMLDARLVYLGDAPDPVPKSSQATVIWPGLVELV